MAWPSRIAPDKPMAPACPARRHRVDGLRGVAEAPLPLRPKRRPLSCADLRTKPPALSGSRPCAATGSPMRAPSGRSAHMSASSGPPRRVTSYNRILSCTIIKCPLCQLRKNAVPVKLRPGHAQPEPSHQSPAYLELWSAALPNEEPTRQHSDSI